MQPAVGLGHWFARRAELTPHRCALVFEGREWTYAEMIQRVNRLAAAMRAGGVCHGDRVAFLGPNHPAFFETLFACGRIGAILVPLNVRLAGPELAYICEDAGVHTLVSAERVDLPAQRRLTFDEVDALIAETQPLVRPDRVDADEVAVIMYTSGTTGRPKGAMLTHGNFFWNNVNIFHAFDVATDDRALVCAPLFHIGGLNVSPIVTLQVGATVVLLRMFDPEAVLDGIERHKVTTMFGVPAMYLFMAQHPKWQTADLSSLRFLICGGAPVPEPLIRTYLERGLVFQQGYGLTETAPFALLLPPEKALEKVGSTGVPPIYTEVALLDANGAEIRDANVRGEICIRGPNVMKGYWNQPEATAEAIDERGWFHSGDVGYLDEDGFFYVVDRVKDMVITGGENVYPAEVESVLYEHPAVAEVAVIGLPDETWGECVTAVVVAKEPVTLDDLRSFAEPRLARFKLPNRIELVEEIPRNPAGKVLKYELRERFGSRVRT